MISPEMSRLPITPCARRIPQDPETGALKLPRFLEPLFAGEQSDPAVIAAVSEYHEAQDVAAETNRVCKVPIAKNADSDTTLAKLHEGRDADHAQERLSKAQKNVPLWVRIVEALP